MSKYYNVEVKAGAKWHLLHVATRHTDALHWCMKHNTEHTKYPMRIVRVVRTTVFEDRNK